MTKISSFFNSLISTLDPIVETRDIVLNVNIKKIFYLVLLPLADPVDEVRFGFVVFNSLNLSPLNWGSWAK